MLDPAKWEATLAAIGAEYLFANAVLSVLRLDTGQMILGASMGIGPAWLHGH